MQSRLPLTLAELLRPQSTGCTAHDTPPPRHSCFPSLSTRGQRPAERHGGRRRGRQRRRGEPREAGARGGAVGVRVPSGLLQQDADGRLLPRGLGQADGAGGAGVAAAEEHPEGLRQLVRAPPAPSLCSQLAALGDAHADTRGGGRAGSTSGTRARRRASRSSASSRPPTSSPPTA